MEMKRETRKIAEIRIGRRSRKQFGDIEGLANSIKDRGLLQPVGIRPDNTLVCGERRIRAFVLLGRTEIPVHICDSIDSELKLIEAERDENTCHEPFTPSEAEDMYQRLLPMCRKAAEESKDEGRKKGGGDRRSDAARNRLGRTSTKAKRDDTKRAASRAAASTGYSASTIKKVEEIKAKAKEDPKTFGDLAKKLDQKGCKVNSVFNAMKKAIKASEDAMAARNARKKLNGNGNHVVYNEPFTKTADRIAPNSISLIFTDPPYDRKSLPLFTDLAHVADRVLIDGGSLITYCGQYVLPEVMAALSGKLRFFWMLCCEHTGQSSRMKEYGIVVKWKPMLWYVKGTFRRDREAIVDDLVISRKEKDVHDWQQSEIEASYYIKSLTKDKEIVFDPFCGGGTTAVAARRLKRIAITCDIDGVAASLAAERILNDSRS
jgi:ParB-like chromosome segregation protein Spo0J